jgi:hypothetical protein
MINFITDKQTWLTDIAKLYPTGDCSALLPDVEGLDGYITEGPEQTRTDTFFLPDIQHVESFIKDIKERGFKIFVHRLQEVTSPDLSKLTSEQREKYFPRDVRQRTPELIKEYQTIVQSLPTKQDVVLYASIDEGQ